ncbi:Sugar efflux transporter B [Pseudoclavibacter triregionum]|nr:Sugar efflux transporter B [Pseudoclavibacter triregionum]
MTDANLSAEPGADPSAAQPAAAAARTAAGQTAGAALSAKLPVIPLLALACSTFLAVTIEMLPTGLMHMMAPDLGVGEAQIGYLMTIFAGCVVVTSTPLTHWLRNVPRHTLLIGVILAFCLGSLGTALAPTYPLVVASRIVAGIAHGVFWAIVASYTALISPKDQLARAISITLGGGSVAFVLGVPLGTALGQLMGWRMAFVVIVGLALVVAALLWRLLPRVDHRAEDAFTAPIEVVAAPTGPEPIEEEYGVEPEPAAAPAARGPRLAVAPRSMAAVALVSTLTGVTMFSEYAFYSYIAPYSTGVIGIPESLLALALFAYGLLSAIATGASGFLFGTRPRLGILLNLAVCVVVGMVMLWLAPGAPAWGFAALAAWGMTMGFLPPLLQSRILTVAPSRHRDIASAIYSSAFNVGIGGGALVGGMLLSGLGIGFLPLFFTIGMALALLLGLFASRLLAAGRAREAAAAR